MAAANTVAQVPIPTIPPVLTPHLPDMIAALTRAKALTLISHRSPDGDTVGSTLALAMVLRSLGKSIAVVCSDSIPPMLGYLSSVTDYRTALPASDEMGDTLVVVDSSDWAQLGALVEPLYQARQGRTLLVIDHHSDTAAYGDVNLIAHTITSCAEIAFHVCLGLLRSAGWTENDPFPPLAAEAIMTGILSDTNSFYNANTTPHALATTAYLESQGARTTAINFRLFRQRRPQAAWLWAQALPTLSVTDEGRVAALAVTQQMLRQANADMSDTEGMVDFLTAIMGVEVSILARETDNGRVKVSLRTLESVDAVALAKQFGGGGHPRAAGCEIIGSLSHAVHQLTQAYRQLRAPSAATP